MAHKLVHPKPKTVEAQQEDKVQKNQQGIS